MYLMNDEIYYINKKEESIIKYSIPKNVIKYGKIYDYKSFLKYFKKMLGSNGYLKIFSNGNIKIIINSLYTNIEKQFLKEICKELNFNKIIFLEEKEIFLDYKNKVYINICNDYIYTYFKKNNKLISEIYIVSDIKKLNIKELAEENSQIYIANNSKYLMDNLTIKYYLYQDYVQFLFDLIYDADNFTKKLDF